MTRRMRERAKAWARSLSVEAPLALAVLVGAGVRLDQLGWQIPLDDEWHALHNTVRYDYGWLMTHFGWTDFSIPLGVYEKLVADTVGLSEWWLRAPVLLSGLASLVLFPRLLRPFIGPFASHVFAWLLALSPLHVFFSRFARPYGISLLLAFAGALAFYAWWTGGALPRRSLSRRRAQRAGALYAACAIVGPYFHLSVLPLVLAPLGYAPLARACARNRSASTRSISEILRLATIVSIGLALLLAAPLIESRDMLAYKEGRGALQAATAWGALELFCGARLPWLFALVLALAFAGFGLLWRERRAFALYLGLVSSVSPLIAWASGPSMIGVSIVLARYCLFLLPVLLLCAALALARLSQWFGRLWPAWPAAILPTVFVLALFATGPLPRIHYRPNDWTNHGMFQYAYRPERSEWNCPPEVPLFYRELARERSEGALIVEAPWLFHWGTNVYPCYQRVHRHRMIIGFVAPLDPERPADLPRAGELPQFGPDGRYRFRSFVHVSDHGELLRRGVRYVVFHTAIEREMASGAPGHRVDVTGWIQEYQSRYGPPIYLDRYLVVFDVAGASRGTSQTQR